MPDATETISLEDGKGTLLLIFSGYTFAGSPAQRQQWQQRFIAELKRRLTAATPPATVPQREGDRDD